MMVASLLVAAVSFASAQSDKAADFQKELNGYTLIGKDNVDLLRGHNWTGKFTAYVGGHKLCEGEIDLSYFHPTQPASELAPAGVPPVDIAYKHTPRFGECLHVKAFAPLLDKLDTVKTPCDPAMQFRTANVGAQPALYTPKCVKGKITWKKLPTVPTSWVSPDGKTLKSLVKFDTPGPKVQVFYDLEPLRAEAAPEPVSSETAPAP